MRIGFIITSLANRGPIVVARDLAMGLTERGHQCTVFFFKDIKDLDFPCETVRINFHYHLDFNAFDIIHCHGVRPDFYVLTHKPIGCKTPVCSTIHSYVFKDHKYKYGSPLYFFTGWLTLLTTVRDNRIIALTKDAKNYYGHFLPKRKVTYAYNTRICDKTKDISDTDRKYIGAFKGKSILLGTCCGLNKRKGLDQVIKALPFLPNYKLAVVGEGPEKDNLIHLGSQLHVTDRVFLMGSRPEAYRFMPYFDIFVMPSYSEGFPLALIEAAQYGKPVVCSDIPLFREILSDGEAVMFQLDNTESLCEAIKAADANRVALGKRIKEKFEATYSPSKFTDRHIEIYQSLIQASKGN